MQQEKKTLNEIIFEYEAIFKDIDEYFQTSDDTSGEIPEEFLERLNINENEVSHKFYKVWQYLTVLKDNAERFKLEAQRLAEKKKRKTKSIEWFTSLLERAVIAYGTPNETGNPKLITDLINATYINKKTLDITHPDLVPNEFKRTIVKINIPKGYNEEQLVQLLKETYGKELEVLATFDEDVDYDKAKAKYTGLEEEKLPVWLTYKKSGYLRFS